MDNRTNRMKRMESRTNAARGWRPAVGVVVAAALCWASPLSSHAAMNVYLFLTANGVKIDGDSTVISMDRENSIECLSFDQSIQQPRDPSTGLPSGRRTYGPIRITKRIDKATPLLAKALAKNEQIDAEFRFYRPNPSGDGTTQHFYTIHVENAGLTLVGSLTESTLDPATANYPALEEVEMVYGTITYTYVPDSIEFSDSLNDPAAGGPTGIMVNGPQVGRAGAVAPANAPKTKTQPVESKSEEKPASEK